MNCTIHNQWGHATVGVNIWYTIHLPYCPSPSVNGCISPVSQAARSPSQNLLLWPFTQVLLSYIPNLTLFFICFFPFPFVFLSLSLFLSLSVMLLLSSKPDQLALHGFLLAPVRPDFTLASLGLSAGRELGDRSLKGRIPDGPWHAGHAWMWQGLAQGSGGPATAVTHQYWACWMFFCDMINNKSGKLSWLTNLAWLKPWTPVIYLSRNKTMSTPFLILLPLKLKPKEVIWTLKSNLLNFILYTVKKLRFNRILTKWTHQPKVSAGVLDW